MKLLAIAIVLCGVAWGQDKPKLPPERWCDMRIEGDAGQWGTGKNDGLFRCVRDASDPVGNIGHLVEDKSAEHQQDKPAPIAKPETALALNSGETSVWASITTWRRYALAFETITKDGHYTWTFDDPNNEYRCTVTSKTDDSATIVCVRPHDVKQEAPAKATP